MELGATLEADSEKLDLVCVFCGRDHVVHLPVELLDPRDPVTVAKVVGRTDEVVVLSASGTFVVVVVATSVVVVLEAALPPVVTEALMLTDVVAADVVELAATDDDAGALPSQLATDGPGIA